MEMLTERTGLPLLSDHWRFIVRHRKPIAWCMAVGLGVGILWSLLLQPASFSATASVVLTPVPMYVTPATVGLVPPEVSIDTDAQMLRSPDVLAAVADVLGSDAQAAQRHLSVTATPGSHVLHITVSAASPVAAARAADAAVTAFAAVRRRSLGSIHSSQLRQLRLFIATQEHVITDDNSRQVLITADNQLFAQFLELRSGLDELLQARTQPVTSLGPAVTPRSSDHSNGEVPITSGAMVGLLGGWLLGTGRDRRRPSSTSTLARRTTPAARAAPATREGEDRDGA